MSVTKDDVKSISSAMEWPSPSHINCKGERQGIDSLSDPLRLIYKAITENISSLESILNDKNKSYLAKACDCSLSTFKCMCELKKANLEGYPKDGVKVYDDLYLEFEHAIKEIQKREGSLSVAKFHIANIQSDFNHKLENINTKSLLDMTEGK